MVIIILNLIIYINGQKIEEKDCKKLKIENDTILQIIQNVNIRRKEKFRQSTFKPKK